jgi:acetyltransferase-like isoleucine patch superfamily enzyme
MTIKEYLKNNRDKFLLLFRLHSFYVKFKRKFVGINWIKTIHLNFKTQEFKTAIRLPILVYGKLKIAGLTGNIKIEAPISTGMIRLGLNTDKFSASKGSALLLLRGTLIFKGNFIASVDYTIDVNVNGILTIGDLCFLGGGVKIRCWKKVTIGKEVRVAFESQIFDSNFHYLRNIQTGKIRNHCKEVTIGDFCWIGNRTTIMKGTHLPDYSVVGSNSLCNKDYSIDNMTAPLIGGIPAKIIGNNFHGIWGKEKDINRFFHDNPEADFYQGDVGIIDESEDRRMFFLYP